MCSKLSNIKMGMRSGVLLQENKNRWQLLDKAVGGVKKLLLETKKSDQINVIEFFSSAAAITWEAIFLKASAQQGSLSNENNCIY